MNHPIITKVAWRLMLTVIICFFFAFFDRLDTQFAEFQLHDSLASNDTAFRLGASLFVIGGMIFGVRNHMPLNRCGARKWLARIIISSGLAIAAMVFALIPWQFYPLRFLIGAGGTASAFYGIAGALLLGAGAILFLLAPGPRAKEGSA